MPDRDDILRTLKELPGELVDALAFLTRLPRSLFPPRSVLTPDIAQAARMFPVAGAIIGAVGGLALLLGAWLGLPFIAAAAIAIATTMLLTGALHEDGLADTTDGFGGGRDRGQKLAIMHDHQIGTYGAAALGLSLLLRAALLADLLADGFGVAFLAMVGSEAGARAAMVRVWYDLPPARPDGLSATAGQPDFQTSLVAAIIGAVLALLTTVFFAGLAGSLAIIGAAAAAALIFAEVSRTQIGGQTGDTLGATEQSSLLVFLIIAAIVV